MKTANDYQGLTDNERIEAAIREREGNIVIIPQRKSNIEPERTWWLLDRAILLPSDTTVILENCRIKLSDESEPEDEPPIMLGSTKSSARIKTSTTKIISPSFRIAFSPFAVFSKIPQPLYPTLRILSIRRGRSAVISYLQTALCSFPP